MKYRSLGKTNIEVSEVGYGMWGMGEWKGSDDNESGSSLDLAIDLGCTFFDTAWSYGAGKSEELLGAMLKRHPGKNIRFASKIPPKNEMWPSKSHYKLEDVFPKSHIIEYVEKSLKNIGTETIDLMQFHVWEDGWSDVDEWKEAIDQLKQQGKVKAFGVSVNRWEPNNCLNTLKTGYIDSVQVIYNIFDQAPEDKLFPLCNKLNIGIIARVPFDEGTLTGNITLDTKFEEGDWRGKYFVPENLTSSVAHADELRNVIPDGHTMAEVALKFILNNPTVSTVIPGMRKEKNVKANIACSGKPLSADLLAELKNHRWDRQPTTWSY